MCKSYCKVNQYYSSVGSGSGTIIIPLGTYPASLLYSEWTDCQAFLSIVFSYLDKGNRTWFLSTPTDLQVRTCSQLRPTRYKRREWTSLSASEQFHRISQTAHHSQSHQWIPLLSSTPLPSTPPRPSPPHPLPLMLEAAVVTALLRRWPWFWPSSRGTLLMPILVSALPKCPVFLPNHDLCAQPICTSLAPPHPNPIQFSFASCIPLPWLWRLMVNTPLFCIDIWHRLYHYCQ